MARIDALPAIEIIRGFKGILDFYYWKGLPCVRMWPRIPPSSRTAASLAAAALFGLIVKSYSLVGALTKAALDEDAADQPRTGRDIYVSAVLGHLHEASMSDFLTLLQESRDFLANLTDLLHALDSVDTDEFVVNVDESVLPTGAATQSTLATISANIAVLNNLRWALASIDNDRFLVRGMDQLFSFKGVLAVTRTAVISGAGGYVDSNPVSAGEFWIVTNVVSMDLTSATTAHLLIARHDAVDHAFDQQIRAFGALVRSVWAGFVYFDVNDVVRVYFTGALAGDSCAVTLTGYRMTIEP